MKEQSVQSIVGIWRGVSSKPKASDFILRFYEDGLCKIYGTLFFGIQKPNTVDAVFEINGDGEYFLEADNEIKINAIIAVQQKSYFNTGGFIRAYYCEKINYGGKFEKNCGDGNFSPVIRLQNEDGIIGFREFIKFEEIRDFSNFL